jgi:multimeric flavodoxin WrbA
MKIVVLNGSPKGPVSVTMQYVDYIARKFPEHEIKIFHVAQRIHVLEKSPERFMEIVEEVRSAELILWGFPLYILLVCSQYKRFIELIADRGAGEAFRGRYAAALSTSINYYDNTAHAYIHGICDDLGMKFLSSYSAHMQDLLKPDERTRLELFARELFAGIEEKATPPRLYQTVNYDPIPYKASAPQRHVSTNGKRVVILSDAKPDQTNLLNMIQRFKDTLQGNVEVFNLYDLDIKGGCLGCMRCGSNYQCAYTGKDGFIDFYNSTLKKADVLVFAGTIVDRQLSWKWRQFFDRSFFNCHTPSLTGKQFAFLISGPLSQLPEIRLVYEAWVELQQSYLTTFISDETENTSDLENTLDSLAVRLIRQSEAGYIRPHTFLGVGGMKIFRDDIWAGLRVVFRADHKAYKRMGIYDFPQKKIGKRILTGLAWFITGLPGIRKRFPAMIKPQMVKPFAKIVKNAKPNQ